LLTRLQLAVRLFRSCAAPRNEGAGEH
jgi:hypothetical protein